MYLIALDESGHGSIAGPMTIGVIKTHESFDQQQLWDIGVCDSKLTTCETRLELYSQMVDLVDIHSITIPVADINTYKHNQCFDLYVKDFVRSLGTRDLMLYVDGLRVIEGLAEMGCLATYMTNGDLSHPMIAAASIVAKYTHDRIVDDLDKLYPQWDFPGHRGYPIPDHVSKIVEMGPLPGVHKLHPTWTAVTNYCKKNSLKVPRWAESKDKLRKHLCN